MAVKKFKDLNIGAWFIKDNMLGVKVPDGNIITKSEDETGNICKHATPIFADDDDEVLEVDVDITTSITGNECFIPKDGEPFLMNDDPYVMIHIDNNNAKILDVKHAVVKDIYMPMELAHKCEIRIHAHAIFNL